MSQRSFIYDLLSGALLLGSLYFFYQATSFLMGRDYVASVLTAGIALVVVRVGVEVGRMALVLRRREREGAGGRAGA